MVFYTLVPPNFRAAVVSRIKIMGELDISEKRRPQDGKIKFEDYGPARAELRVLTMPTANGLENVVMRILAAPKALSLETVGLAPRILADLQRLAAKPYGLLFVCGPTGSGKTTTLHSLLAQVNTPERKVWTVEDPIEITQEGLCQVQVNTKIGVTFAEVLRSFVRADPDVIMVGETRDADTASTVIAASLTGHLVLSTMHTNSAVESVTRLLDLGMDPFTFADAMLGIVGQRLVRRLCTSCREPHFASAGELAMFASEYCEGTNLQTADVISDWRIRHGNGRGDITLHTAGGCEQCAKSGYAGRLGLHELLVGSEMVKRKIHARANVAELTEVAMNEGMRSIKQDGIEKVLLGHTDMKQVLASCQ
jgi:type II secretory ATPase GspE/PulE/Tfp pilus assembly ATPase PilB-like protein